MLELFCPLKIDCTEPNLQIYLTYEVFVFIIMQSKHCNFQTDYAFSRRNDLVDYNYKATLTDSIVTVFQNHVLFFWLVPEKGVTSNYLEIYLSNYAFSRFAISHLLYFNIADMSSYRMTDCLVQSETLWIPWMLYCQF